ncbi:MAG TPA: hypothetical protein VG165_12615 [Solirubrobacteraceae bacterium]|jgi:hypothetical protein|nr:hypothetical protein [Solirubrobacteraceae bacterium]
MQIDTLSRLVRESRYPLDNDEIAEAILARITMPVLTPQLRPSHRRRSVRSFHPARHISSFHLVRSPRRRIARPTPWPA